MFSFDSLCNPAKINLVLAILVLISNLIQRPSIISVVISIIWIPLWTMFLNWLCKKGYSFISWGFVFLPLFGLVLMTFGLAGLVVTKNK